MKILLDDKEYELGQVTLSQYLKVKELNKTGGNMSDAEFISFMTGIPLDDIRQATIPQIGFVAKTIDVWFQNTSKTDTLKQLINYKGEMLGLLSPSQMTYGEWTDLEVLFAQPERNYQHIAAILYRPCETFNVETLDKKIVKYNYEECLERSKEMGDLPISDILSAIFFLIMYAEKLTNKRLSSLEAKMKMMESNHQTKEQNKKS